jgi:hypothetical protein
MTEEEREEGAEEAIEDLEAPAAAQRDVAGGLMDGPVNCAKPTCVHSKVNVWCLPPTCAQSNQDCDNSTKDIIVKLQ